MTIVMLLEDNADMLAMLGQVLDWGGYQVWGARDGREGLRILEEQDSLPDIIVSDLRMPDLDAIAFLKRLRANPAWAKIPCVVMSAQISEEERQQARAAGANDFLIKPFMLADFQAILNRWNPSG
jgi:CheY-like chemotaxis protein